MIIFMSVFPNCRRIDGSGGALTEKLAPSSTNNLSLAHQQLNQQLKNQLHQQLATIVGGVTAQLVSKKSSPPPQQSDKKQ